MEGLLDFIKTPAGQGLLSAAFGGLAGARRGRPLNSIGRAGVAGLLGYSQAQDRATKDQQEQQMRQVRDLQIKGMQQQQQDADALRGFDFGQFYQSPAQQALAQGGGPTSANAANIGAFQPKLDTQGMIAAMMGSQSPALRQQALGMLTKEDTPMALGEGAKLVTRSGRVIADNPKAPELKEGYLERGPDGQWRVNKDLLDVAMGMKRAGASNTSVKIENKTGESIAGQVGPMLKDSRDKAISGVRLVDSANRILDAAEKGNLFAGPGANLLLKGAQVADVLGFGGKSVQEKIANTRQVVRGMAEQAVAARSQLGGQAQISNSEQELLNKATAGDIAELTTGEIIDIAKLNDRLGRQLYGVHQDQLGNLKNDPNLSALGRFYQVPPILPQRQKSAAQGGVKFLGYE